MNDQQDKSQVVMDAPAHTPPWQIEPEFPCDIHKGFPIAHFENEGEARFALRAVNSHDDLVAALRNVEGVVADWFAIMEERHGRNWRGNHPSCLDDLRAAIRKATQP